MFDEEIRTLRSMGVREAVSQLVQLGCVVTSALILWKILILVCFSESPIVVVLSRAMEPGYYRGDLLLLTSPNRPIAVGDICVYKLDGRDVPIVHRVHRVHEDAKGEKYILTKGDNNHGDDRNLYDPGQDWIHEANIVGRSTAYVSYVGMLTILLAENFALKVAVLGVLGFFVLTSKEDAQ
jgi:signal peptidase